MVHWFLKTKHFIPDAHEKTIYDIDYKALKTANITVLFFDIDNTLIPYDLALPTEPLINHFDTLAKYGFKIVFVSNNHYRRIKKFSEALGYPFVHSAKKPSKFGLKRALKMLDVKVEKSEIMFVGDQLMTDVYGAKRFGINVTLVEPIKRKTEKWYTKINRYIETKMLKKIQKKYPDKYDNLKLDTR